MQAAQQIFNAYPVHCVGALAYVLVAYGAAFVMMWRWIARERENWPSIFGYDNYAMAFLGLVTAPVWFPFVVFGVLLFGGAR